jgi:hypothetical protein
MERLDSDLFSVGADIARMTSTASSITQRGRRCKTDLAWYVEL